MARQFPRWIAPIVSLLLPLASGAATIHNDASCDIGVAPAATLLLPYFEVDLDDPNGETTIFTITNTRNTDRVARVTLWTDFAVPVLTFNVYLSGYDVQSISLYDVLVRGLTPDRIPERGPYSIRNRRLDTSECAQGGGPLPKPFLDRIRSAFTEGTVPSLGGSEACNSVGYEHDDAVGYATIDVVGNCAGNGPDSPAYWTEDLRYDNVLIGDMQQIDSAENFAQASPLVHIRAVPEGGTPQQRAAIEIPFERTFYALYQSPGAPRLDARQPLPSVFAARWIQGGRNGFATSLKVWRQGTSRTTTCASHEETGETRYLELTRFDEAENAVADVSFCRMLCIDPIRSLPATSRTLVSDSGIYPQLTNGAVAGWMYLNLDNSVQDAWGGQNWVVTSMRAEGRYSVDSDAAPLGNGCSSPAGESEIRRNGGMVIGPRP